MIDSAPSVNSHNDWDPLEEVIVGAPFHLDYANDVTFRLFFHQNLSADDDYETRKPGAGHIFDDPSPGNTLCDEMLEDLEGFIALLEHEGVTVRRPEILTAAKPFSTPDWSSVMGHAMMSRDLFIVIGDEIIETSPMIRPGTLLLSEGTRIKELPEFVRGWDVIRYSPLSIDYVDDAGLPLLASQSIGMNVLLLDKNRIVVQDIQYPLIQQLHDAGFAPIPCRWRDGRVVGGGFHCMTLDTVRRGPLEDYTA